MTPDVQVVTAVLGKLAELAQPVEAVDELELTTTERERWASCAMLRNDW